MEQKKVFLVHGFNGTPNGGWRSWIMGQLALKDIYACSLPMPTPDVPVKEEWISEIKHAIPVPTEEIFLVGHSLGVPAILNYLELLPEGKKIGGVLLVAGPVESLESENLNSKYRAIDGFFKDFDFNKIKKSSAQFTVIHSIDDPKVPVSHSKKLSSELGCELAVLSNGGHLSDDILELPEAFSAIMHFLK